MIKIEIEDFFNIEKSEIDWENYKYGKMVSSISIFSVNNSTYAICTGFGILIIVFPHLGQDMIGLFVIASIGNVSAKYN